MLVSLKTKDIPSLLHNGFSHVGIAEIADKYGVGTERKSMPRGGARVRSGDGSKNIVGIRVQARREELGWSQAKLTARIAYVTGGAWNPSAQEVTHIETGRRTVLDLEIFALAQALECSAAWLLTGKTDDLGELDLHGGPEAQLFLPGKTTP